MESRGGRPQDTRLPPQAALLFITAQGQEIIINPRP
jgi:hypothetical protein